MFEVRLRIYTTSNTVEDALDVAFCFQNAAKIYSKSVPNRFQKGLDRALKEDVVSDFETKDGEVERDRAPEVTKEQHVSF